MTAPLALCSEKPGIVPGCPKRPGQRTTCSQVWNSEDAEDEALCMVVCTGLNTTMGAMVRQLIAPVNAKKEKEPFEPVCHSLAASSMHCCYMACML